MSTQSVAARRPSILVVDDEPSMLQYARTLLEMDQYSVETATSGEEAVRRLEAHPPIDLILLDMAMPRMDGLQTIQACKRLRPDQRIVVCSCVSETSTVVQAIKMGALDYMTKPFYKSELDAILKRSLAVEHSSVVPEENNQMPVTEGPEHFESLENDLFFLAASPAMRQIRSQISLVDKVDVPVLLLGESGVGKEILARLIHKLSTRSRNPLLKVNCAALPADLLESELFGYEQGAFTGATRPKPGKFELCNKGTILLDEIGEMSPVLQAKLLHVLQDGQFSRLGSRSTIAADFRVLAATNVDVQKAIAEKSFREDLYYRLQAVVKVFAERLLGNCLLHIHVGCGKHAEIRGDGGTAAEAGKLSVLQDVQELCLQHRTHLANLVQQDGSFVAQLELAGLGPRGAGESTLLISKQLAFKQVGRQRRAIHFEQRIAGAGRQLVNEPRQNFFAYATLTQQEDGDIYLGN